MANSVERDFREKEEQRLQESAENGGENGSNFLRRAPSRQSEAILHYIGIRFEAILAQNPEDSDALYHWGLRLQEEAEKAQASNEEDGRLGILELACTKYAQAAKIAPDFQEAFYNWGVALADIAAIHRTGPQAIEALRVSIFLSALKTHNVLRFNEYCWKYQDKCMVSWYIRKRA